MGSNNDYARHSWYWEHASNGVSRFVPAGDLDLDVLAELVAVLGIVPPGSTHVIDIDLSAVTFLDGRTAILLARYRKMAYQLGKEVRIVKAAGMPRKVLTVLGVLPSESASGASDTPLSRTGGPSAADRRTVAGDVFSRARGVIARSGELCRKATRLGEAFRRHERG